MTHSSSNIPSEPWWKFGHVWLVIAGPALVVIASLATYYVAVHGMDTVIDEPVTVIVPTGASATQNSHAPAVQARNHAATGTAAKP